MNYDEVWVALIGAAGRVLAAVIERWRRRRDDDGGGDGDEENERGAGKDGA
jgi:hypothetical protein